MNIKSSFIIFFLITLYFDLVFLQASESEIKNAIFKDYNKKIRPADFVEIYLKLTLKQIVSLDEKNQIVTTSSFLFAYWLDQRLSWDTANYSGILNVQINSIWLPDFYVINTADSNGYITVSDSAYGFIYPNGEVVMNLGLVGKKNK